MVFIPPGAFMMGSPQGEAGHGREEVPEHLVRIAEPFYLGKYEVTQAEWQAVMPGNPSRSKGADFPVDAAAWDDFQAFIGELNGP
ncbi:MAG: SUMF1/EgtB/PvdO family nonheme iron enzyme, partial [Planctomycetes bacterium]|nr:SUMF1/EgtB/PvdO family nonheme iron enzyme [Planctomycetota bacterium]